MDLTKFKKGIGGLKGSPFFTRAFILIFLVAFFNYNSSTMLAITLPKYANDLGATSQQVGLLSGIFATAAFIMRPISGQVVDNENKLTILRICILTMIVAVFGLTLSTNYNMIVIFRALNGLAWGIGSTLTMTIATNCFDAKNMATGIGIYGLGQTMAQTIAPLFALPFALKYGYNNLYFVNVSLLIMCFIMTLFMKIEYVKPKVKKYSFNIKKMVCIPALMPAALTMCNFVAKAGIMAFLVIYTGTLGIANIAIFFTVQAATIFISRPFIAKLADKFGAIKVLVPCEVLTVLAMVTVAFGKTVPMFVVAAVFAGLAMAGEQPILMAECVRSVDASKRGSASNTCYMGVDIGNILGSNFAGVIVAYLGYQSMFLAMAVPAIVCTVIYVYFYNKKKNSQIEIEQTAA